MTRLAFTMAIIAAIGLGGTARSQPAPVPALTVYSAGSMAGALGAMLKRYTAETGRPVDLHTGPAGQLLQKIEAGDKVDLFVSANMAHPQKLTAAGKSTATVVFARNRICVAARPDVALTSANLLQKLLDPQVKIGTSTPRADPGGDYAWALFDKADTVRPGAGATLKAKAQQLVGGTGGLVVPKGQNAVEYFLAEHRVDVFVGYCSSHETTRDPGFDQVELPAALAIQADYGMTVLTTGTDSARREAADRLALYLMSPAAQAMMVPYGFTPVAAASPP